MERISDPPEDVYLAMQTVRPTCPHDAVSFWRQIKAFAENSSFTPPHTRRIMRGFFTTHQGRVADASATTSPASPEARSSKFRVQRSRDDGLVHVEL